MSSSVNSGLFGVNQLYQQLIDNLITLESNKKFSYEDQITQQQSRKSAITTVGSKLTSFNSTLADFAAPTGRLFNLFSAASSNETAFTVSASSSLNTSGSFNLEIQQLAKSDVRVSSRFIGADFDIQNAITAANGEDELDFTLNTGSSSYNITIADLAGKTNEEILQSISDQINAEAGDSVQSTILRESSGQVRLSVRSKETGLDNAISFSNTIDGDGFTNIAEFIEFTVDNGGPTADDNNVVPGSGSPNGGRLYALNTLDAQFTIDGLNFTRSKNTVSDAISNLTINLKKVTTQNETITIESDTTSAKDNLTRFIDSFNSVISEIRTQSFLNSTSGDRGPLYRDRSFKELTYTLRQDAISTVLDASINIVDPMNPVIPNGIAVKNILDIGLDIRNDGTMYISDQSKLDSILSSDPDSIQRIFSSDRPDQFNGIASKLQASLDAFIKADGVVSSLQLNIDERIELLNKQVESQEQFLVRRRKQLTNQFIQLQSISDQANSQFQTLASMGSFYQ